MITDAIISALLAALDALVSLVPVVTLPVLTVTSFATQFASLISGIHRAAPLGDALAVLALGLLVMFALATFDLGVWVYHQFWGSS